MLFPRDAVRRRVLYDFWYQNNNSKNAVPSNQDGRLNDKRRDKEKDIDIYLSPSQAESIDLPANRDQVSLSGSQLGVRLAG